MSQNRYYWGVVLATLSEWCGHEPEELHDYLKRYHLDPVRREFPTGLSMRIVPSTTNLAVEEFSGYVDKVVQWAAEQGVNVPSPDEVA